MSTAFTCNRQKWNDNKYLGIIHYYSSVGCPNFFLNEY